MLEPLKGAAGMLVSVVRRPGRGHGCWVSGGLYLLFSEGLGRQAPDRPPSESEVRAGVCQGIGPVESYPPRSPPYAARSLGITHCVQTQRKSMG